KAGNIKTMLFGGEGLFFATLTGPGRVWLQSLPFSRLAGRMLAAAPRGGSQSSSPMFSFLSGGDSDSSSDGGGGGDSGGDGGGD
ncbi:MAG TPA: AIM24 family protein, partial [Magnetospirillum sp.]|nr:AIM24 family protein [Magnetospirillum sp.]